VGYPTKPLDQLTVDEVKTWLHDHQVTAVNFMWVHQNNTLKDIWKAQRLQETFDEVLDDPEGRRALMNPALKRLLEKAAA